MFAFVMWIFWIYLHLHYTQYIVQILSLSLVSLFPFSYPPTYSKTLFHSCIYVSFCFLCYSYWVFLLFSLDIYFFPFPGLIFIQLSNNKIVILILASIRLPYEKLRRVTFSLCCKKIFNETTFFLYPFPHF